MHSMLAPFHVAEPDEILDVRVRHVDGPQQGARVGMQGMGKERIRHGNLRNPPQVQHDNAIAEVADHAQVVRDEKERQLQLGLELTKQV